MNFLEKLAMNKAEKMFGSLSQESRERLLAKNPVSDNVHNRINARAQILNSKNYKKIDRGPMTADRYKRISGIGGISNRSAVDPRRTQLNGYGFGTRGIGHHVSAKMQGINRNLRAAAPHPSDAHNTPRVRILQEPNQPKHMKNYEKWDSESMLNSLVKKEPYPKSSFMGAKYQTKVTHGDTVDGPVSATITLPPKGVVPSRKEPIFGSLDKPKHVPSRGMKLSMRDNLKALSDTAIDVPKKVMNYFEKEKSKPMSDKERQNQKVLRAIVTDHEANEAAIFARKARAMARNGVLDKVMDNSGFGGPLLEPHTNDTQISSHLSPEVLMRESELIRNAPKEVKDRMVTFRSNNKMEPSVHYSYNKLRDIPRAKQSAAKTLNRLSKSNGDKTPFVYGKTPYSAKGAISLEKARRQSIERSHPEYIPSDTPSIEDQHRYTIYGKERKR